jgi:hypothetical protein
VAHAYNPSYWGSRVQKDRGSSRRIAVQSDLGKKQDPISNITRAKMAECVSQRVEHLLQAFHLVYFTTVMCPNVHSFFFPKKADFKIG